MTLKHPKSARHGLLYLLGELYKTEFLLLHRKSDTKARVGEDLKVLIEEIQLQAIRVSDKLKY
jgi:hypothetical protein